MMKQAGIASNTEVSAIEGLDSMRYGNLFFPVC